MADADKEKQISISYAELEQIKAMSRVETLVSMQTDALNSHKEDDDKNFNNLHMAIRNVQLEIAEIPKTMYTCRDDIEKKIHDDVSKDYVSKEDFNKFAGKITYTLGGIMLLGMFATWVISLAVNVQKLSGGG